MSNYKKLTAAALAAFAIAISLGSSPAAAATCDGSWQTPHVGIRNGHYLQTQCYYLPTVSNGRVTGLEYKQNLRWVPIRGAAIGTGQPPRYR
jgi:hypothetical protein